MKNNKYVISTTESSFCPNCGKPEFGVGKVDLLCPRAELRDELPLTYAFMPSFYICFDCRFVGQVGEGPVPRGIEDVEDEG